MNPYRIIITLLVVLVLAFGCDGDFDLVGPLETEDQAPDILTGEVVLENMEDHAGVRVELQEISTSLITQDSGEFVLPENLAEGDWTIQTSYPYFLSASQSFTVQNGMPADELLPMQMEQQILFSLISDTPEYYLGETVTFRLLVENLTDQTVTLSSLTSPQIALAVRFEGETILGDLLPGDQEEGRSMILNPFETIELGMSWPLDDPEVTSGKYQVFGVVTDDVNYPLYFSKDEELVDQFNETLYEKLDPANITIL